MRRFSGHAAFFISALKRLSNMLSVPVLLPFESILSTLDRVAKTLFLQGGSPQAGNICTCHKSYYRCAPSITYKCLSTRFPHRWHAHWWLMVLSLMTLITFFHLHDDWESALCVIPGGDTALQLPLKHVHLFSPREEHAELSDHELGTQSKYIKVLPEFSSA